MKRIFLFVLTNIAVLALVSVVLFVLGLLGFHLPVVQSGANLGPLLVVGALFGFGGAFISLLM